MLSEESFVRRLSIDKKLKNKSQRSDQSKYLGINPAVNNKFEMLEEFDDPDRIRFVKNSASNGRQATVASVNSGTRHRIVVNATSNENVAFDDSLDTPRPQSALSLAGIQPLVGSRPLPPSAPSSPDRAGGAASPLSTSTQNSLSEASLSAKVVSEQRSHEGPSSRRTVLVIASFFVVGLINLLSGLIVLTTESHHAFVIAGSLMVGVGVVSFVLCGYLQQKNLKKFMRDWEQDLYFLNLRQTSNVLRSFFNFDFQSARGHGPNHA